MGDGRGYFPVQGGYVFSASMASTHQMPECLLQCDNHNVSRHCHMSSGEREKSPQVRTTAIESLDDNSQLQIFIIIISDYNTVQSAPALSFLSSNLCDDRCHLLCPTIKLAELLASITFQPILQKLKTLSDPAKQMTCPELLTQLRNSMNTASALLSRDRREQCHFSK